MLFDNNFQTSFFNFNGIINTGFYDRFKPGYFSIIREPNLTPHLRVLSGFDQNTIGIF